MERSPEVPSGGRMEAQACPNRNFQASEWQAAHLEYFCGTVDSLKAEVRHRAGWEAQKAWADLNDHEFEACRVMK